MYTFAILMSFLLTALPVVASPLLISDNRIDEISESIVVGRGYSMGSNRVFTNCFTEMEYLDPSFDINYRIQAIDESYLNQSPGDLNSLQSLKREFVRFHARFEESEDNSSGQGKTIKLKNVLLSLDVESYYESFNDLNSFLHESKLKLLRTGNYSAFTQECGSHYIRSIGRVSSFLSLLTFQSTDKPNQFSDGNFIEELKRLITAFSEKAPISPQFDKELKERKLSISTEAIGIDKSTFQHIQMAPKSIDELRDSIQELVASMQNDETGLIGSMELVPWTDNSEYLDFLIFESNSAKDRYLADRNLRDNNIIIDEIDRIDASINDLLVRSSLCSRILIEDYPVGRDEFAYDPDNTWFTDLGDRSNIKKHKTLSELKKAINPSLVEKIRNLLDEFYIGNPDSTSTGALDCLENLHGDKIFQINYKELPSCLYIEKYRALSLPIIDHYCMPQLVIRPSMEQKE